MRKGLGRMGVGMYGGRGRMFEIVVEELFAHSVLAYWCWEFAADDGV